MAAFATLVLLLAPPALAAPRLEHRFSISPAEIRSSDTRSLAKALVRRLHEECDAAGAPAPGEKPVGDDAELIMMVPSAVIASVAKFGFLNQHETLTTQGVYSIPDRFATEQELAMARLPYSRKGKQLLPKYALFASRRSDFGAIPLPTRYGGVAVVFKKEVMKRATWTYADSADFRFLAGRISRGGAANPVLTHTPLYRRKTADKNRCGNYCEAQIWGELTLEDVDYLMLGKDEPAAPALFESGLRVYRFKADASAPAGFVRGELLSRAAAVPVASEAADRAVKNHLKDLQRESMSEAALIERKILSLSDVGELAARPKNAAIVGALVKTWRGADPAIRAAALYGLSELPWERFRPYVLEGLNDKDPRINTQAVALASEHLEDADVGRLLAALRQRPSKELLETSDWLDRPVKPRFCDESMDMRSHIRN